MESKKVPTLLNQLAHEGLGFMQALNDKEQEKGRTKMGQKSKKTEYKMHKLWWYVDWDNMRPDHNKKTDEPASEQVYRRARTVEAQRAPKSTNAGNKRK